MGRGRGKGKKTAVTTHEDPGSGGEEVVPAYRRRGRPQKPLKEDFDEDDIEKVEEGDDVKPMASSKEVKSLAENGKKRRRHSQVKESSDSVLEEKNSVIQVSNDESNRSNGFRANGSRRKSKPRRAAEAGVECK
ncbi:uncharacterized protein [Typha angustifolia]|uniref:uncharacterized protein n=1 Tax=Typha angustifolia TaxID=59011 RepID=UPI003C2DC558